MGTALQMGSWGELHTRGCSTIEIPNSLWGVRLSRKEMIIKVISIHKHGQVIPNSRWSSWNPPSQLAAVPGPLPLSIARLPLWRGNNVDALWRCTMRRFTFDLQHRNYENVVTFSFIVKTSGHVGLLYKTNRESFTWTPPSESNAIQMRDR